MSKPYQGFEPKWFQQDYSKDTYRSIFKWGTPSEVKIPNENLYKLMKSIFKLDDNYFSHYDVDLGLDKVKFDIPSKLSTKHLEYFQSIVGKDFVRTDDYARLSVAYGKTMYDVLRLRKKVIENLPDVVIYPDTKEQIEKIVAYCAKHKIPVYVYGGGSSVTRGVECMKGGISLDMRLRYNKVIEFKSEI
ncbi:MAG: FAD-binding protein [Bacilli bacterium]|nr:FAD-binding protein [Bacilli bacterium]